MKLSELQDGLAKHPQLHLRFVLPDGEAVPAHAHVTEVARIDKRFVDCGGTLRNEAYCRLQTWVADDVDHRLSAGKLLKILEKAAPVLLANDVEVDIEYEHGIISQYPLASADATDGELVLRLAKRHTACLAEDKCRTSPAKTRSIYFKPLPRLS